MKGTEVNIVKQKKEKNIKNANLKYGIIEVTSYCQLACPGCYMVRRQKLNKGHMSLDKAIYILDLCKDYIGAELETMDILGGEPLLWPYLKTYIDILLKRGISPWLFTNMLKITPVLAKWLLERNIYITGKMNICPDNAEDIVLQAKLIGRNRLLAQKMIDNISIFTDAGYKSPMFRLENLVRKDNIELVPAYYDWCLKRNIGIDIELMGSGEEIDENYWSVAPKPIDIANMINRIQLIRQQRGLEKLEVLMPHIFSRCHFYDKGLYFAVDGTIRACSNSTVTLSNIQEAFPIKKARDSKLICSRITLKQEKIGKPCSDCDRWDRCEGGCRATAEGSGDADAGYSLCPVPYLKNN